MVASRWHCGCKDRETTQASGLSWAETKLAQPLYPVLSSGQFSWLSRNLSFLALAPQVPSSGNLTRKASRKPQLHALRP